MWLGTVASVYAVLLHGATWAQIRKSTKRRSVEDLSVAIPLGCILVFGFWILYGMSLRDMFIYAPDMVGIILGGILVIVYARYKQGFAPQAYKAVVAGIGLLWLGLAVLCVLAWSSGASVLFGKIAFGGSAAMHVALLMQIWKSAKRRSVDDIAASVPFGAFGSYTVWALYGFAMSNHVLELSGTIGIVLAGILCVQYLVFRKTV